MKEILLTTKDNIQIAINHFETNSDTVVIIAPGWCMTKDSKAFLEISEMFANHYDVITLDFRGHGESKGTYTFSAKEILDINTVVDYASAKYKNICLAGFSLGGGIALICAAQNEKVNKVIAVSPHSDFSKIENKMWKKDAWWETFKKFELKRFLSIRLNPIPYKKIKPIDIVKNITIPTLFVAGKKDPTVYFWHTKLLFENATCKKDFKLYKDGIHAEDLYIYNKKDFEKICIDWINLS